MRVACAHDVRLFELAVFLHGESGGIACRDACGTQEQRRRGGKVFAVTGLRVKQEFLERRAPRKDRALAVGRIGEAGEMLGTALERLGARQTAPPEFLRHASASRAV